MPAAAWLHHDLDELDRHVRGAAPVVLLGDAAHGFTPNLGEGAAQAILDAAWLRACLRDGDLHRYPGPRRGGNARIALASRWIGRLGEASGWPGALRDTLLTPFATRTRV